MAQALGDLSLYYLPMEDKAFAEGPWPYFDAARAQHPWLARCQFGTVVHQLDAIKDLLLKDDSMRTAHEQIVQLMDAHGTPWGRFQEEMILAYSGDAHKRLRTVLAPAFTPRAANRHRPLMQKVIGDLLDEWVPKGRFDFEEFASYFPITVMCSLIGMPTSAVPGLRHSMEVLGNSLAMDHANMPALQEATETLDRYARDMLARRRGDGPSREEDEDLLDVLVATQARGDMSEQELIDLLVFLFVAGYDTSKNALTLMMSVLVDRPDDYERCAEDPAFCRRVVEENFRFHTTATIPRLTTKDIVYRDVAIPAGTMLFMPVSVSGRDPVIPDAHRLPARAQAAEPPCRIRARPAHVPGPVYRARPDRGGAAPDRPSASAIRVASGRPASVRSSASGA